MFCNHCGAKLPDGSAFCHVCGSKTALNMTEEAQEKIPAQPPIQQTIPQSVQQPVQQQYIPQQVIPPAAAPKKKHIGLIIGIIVAVLAIAIVAGIVIFILIPKEQTVNDFTYEYPSNNYWGLRSFTGTYTGICDNGVPDGHGRFESESSTVYSYVNGETYSTKYSIVIEGEWQNGNLISGTRTITYREDLQRVLSDESGSFYANGSLKEGKKANWRNLTDLYIFEGKYDEKGELLDGTAELKKCRNGKENDVVGDYVFTGSYDNDSRVYSGEMTAYSLLEEDDGVHKREWLYSGVFEAGALPIYADHFSENFPKLSSGHMEAKFDGEVLYTRTF